MTLSELSAGGRTVFLEGPYGTGKTTLAIEHIFDLLAQGVPPERLIVLVPQRTLGRPYHLAMRDVERGPHGHVSVRTVSGLARDMVALWWPLVSEQAGFAQPDLEPVFLSIETAQYYMLRQFLRPALDEGKFDAVNVPPERIASQIIDNLNKAALMGIPFAEVGGRLRAAWGDRPSNRLLVYTAAQEVGSAFRQYCLQHSLLDYSLQIEVFTRHLLTDPAFREQFYGGFTHLIADNVEEDTPVAHDLIRDWLPRVEHALLMSDSDGGFRVFLGADLDGAQALRGLCDEVITLDQSHVNTPALNTLAREVRTSLGRGEPNGAAPDANVHDAFEYAFHDYYPQMLDWVVDEIDRLVHEEGVAPGEIVILAPFLGDALRFSLSAKLAEREVESVSHRPSRALREEPAARAMLALAALAHPEWGLMPPSADVAAALGQAVDGLDPVRARLLTKVIYRPRGEAPLAPFGQIQGAMQARITFSLGERYERLRQWLAAYVAETAAGETAPLDHFFSRLFGEVLSQPGFGFHASYEAGRVVAQLVESARRFRQVLYVGEEAPLSQIGRDYLTIVNEGLLAALHVPSWRDEARDAVFMAPAYTLVMRNRVADYQFWLDVGSTGWWERLDQPLTHPYVLSRGWPADQMWTDAHEFDARQDVLYRVVLGLVRRCRRKIYLGISDLGEQGFEQRGPLLRLFQQVLRRNPAASELSE